MLEVESLLVTRLLRMRRVRVDIMPILLVWNGLDGICDVCRRVKDVEQIIARGDLSEGLGQIETVQSVPEVMIKAKLGRIQIRAGGGWTRYVTLDLHG